MTQITKIVVSGARGPRGFASGPLGEGAVTADAISDNGVEQSAIFAKIAGDLASNTAGKGADLVFKEGAGTVQDTISLLEGVSVAPSITGTFIADGSTAKFGTNMVLTGTSVTQNEIGQSIVLTNDVVAGGGKAYTVAHFAANFSGASAATAYAANYVLQLGGGPGTGLEVNVNNNGVNSGDSYAENSLFGAYIWVTGQNIVAAGSHRLMAAYQIDATPAYLQQINRGFSAAGDSVRLVTFSDATNSSISYLMTGTHSTGIDMTGATISSQKAIALTAGQYINWVVGGTPQQVIGVSGTVLQVGYGTSATNFGSNFIPGADNAFSIGLGGASVSNIYSQNAVTVTSDLREKDVIGNLRDEMDVRAFVRNIRAILYRSKVGENEPQTITEPGMVVAKDTDGLDIIDQIPVYDDDGEPVMIEVPDWDKMPKRSKLVKDSETGEERLIEMLPNWQTGDPTKWVQKTDSVPRMVEGMVEKTIYVPRAGRRPHAGFGAQHFEAELERQGVDCGVFVRKEDGSLALRYEQAVPFLWEAFDLMEADYAALAQRVSALEGGA